MNSDKPDRPEGEPARDARAPLKVYGPCLSHFGRIYADLDAACAAPWPTTRTSPCCAAGDMARLLRASIFRGRGATAPGPAFAAEHQGKLDVLDLETGGHPHLFDQGGSAAVPRR
ncbi:MAG: hypothetical protein ACLU98_06915 [Desulfovibrio fairfieldensis]